MSGLEKGDAITLALMTLTAAVIIVAAVLMNGRE